jgi:hypothetical protein
MRTRLLSGKFIGSFNLRGATAQEIQAVSDAFTQRYQFSGYRDATHYLDVKDGFEGL